MRASWYRNDSPGKMRAEDRQAEVERQVDDAIAHALAGPWDFADGLGMTEGDFAERVRIHGEQRAEEVG